MATTAARLGDNLIKLLTGRTTSSLTKAALLTLQVATDGTQEATKFITTDTNINQGVAKVTALHVGTSGSEVQVNATGAEINQAFDLSAKGESVVATNVLTVADNGKIFFLNAIGGFTTTLPALSTVSAGWTCRLIVGTNNTTEYILSEHGDDTDKMVTNFIHELDVDAGQDGVYNADHTTLDFVANTSKIGDWVEVETDGAVWYINGCTADDGAITVA